MVNPTPTPLSLEERNDLLDYGNWRMNGLRCSLDPLRREVNVTALTDDKALMMISCEAGPITPLIWHGLCRVKATGLAPGSVAFAVQQRSGDE